MMMRHLTHALAVFATISLAGAARAQVPDTNGTTSLPEDFFGKSSSMQELDGRNSDPGFPIFPRVGNPDAPVSLDYFYSHDCAPCIKASKAIFSLLANGEDIEVVFHPVGVTEETYFDAVAETILFSIEPKAFEMYHFGSMAASERGAPLDSRVFMRDVAEREGKTDILRARLDNYEEWTSSLSVNSALLDSLDADDLPVFLINDSLYQGFTTMDDLVGAIRREHGEEILKSEGRP